MRTVTFTIEIQIDTAEDLVNRGNRKIIANNVATALGSWACGSELGLVGELDAVTYGVKVFDGDKKIAEKKW